MENTASVATSTRRAPCCRARRRPASRAATSECGYTSVRARESRQPSTRLAWLSASERTTSSGPANAGTSPQLAA